MKPSILFLVFPICAIACGGLATSGTADPAKGTDPAGSSASGGHDGKVDLPEQGGGACSGSGQDNGPYCPWNGCLDGPRASCGSDRQWHCPTAPEKCCYASGSSQRIPCDEPHVCSYPPAKNDPRCPSAYSFSYYGTACSPVGLSCAYPGAGDGTSGGCFATAMMWCQADAPDAGQEDGGDGGDVDGGGADGGTGTWTVAQ